MGLEVLYRGRLMETAPELTASLQTSHHISGRMFHLRRQIYHAPGPNRRRIFGGIGFEPETHQSRNRELTTRPTRPLLKNRKLVYMHVSVDTCL
ncbi:hypothetical protein AVEN_48917-1 [Araneus ventricosus]|uniref:Uncharacterized protein n=1 Tax=Araneus ventricosus TaxID=182803 RepID=A0A4Y2AGU0_ARAVE|nr:hypothetical protein AVEN_48917-1 [Araneus ventricosus]